MPISNTESDEEIDLQEIAAVKSAEDEKQRQEKKETDESEAENHDDIAQMPDSEMLHKREDESVSLLYCPLFSL